MNNEIKEILEQSLDYEFNLTFKQRKELLDYITDLQEESQMFERMSNWACKNMFAYKSRIDKAVEYIKSSMNNPQPFYEYIYGGEDGNVENLDKLLNILTGGNE